MTSDNGLGRGSHAPAPWALRRSSQGDYAVSDASGNTVASINTFHRSRSAEHDALIEATAALILDAPDLLRLLGAIVDARVAAKGSQPEFLALLYRPIMDATAMVGRLRAGRVDPAKESVHAV